MSKFWMTTEDPMYDEDGVLVDEDAEWEDLEDYEIPPHTDTFDPFETINS